MEQINENNTVTMHQAELYLRNEENPTSLYVRIEGKRRRLFINRSTGLIGIIANGIGDIVFQTGSLLKRFIIQL